MKIFIQLFRFGAVGIVNTLFGLIIIYGLAYFFGIWPLIANLIGYSFGLLLSFFLNQKWTFNNSENFRNLFPRYMFFSVVCYIFNVITFLISSSFISTNQYLSQLLGVFVYSISMFLVCRVFVFTERKSVS